MNKAQIVAIASRLPEDARDITVFGRGQHSDTVFFTTDVWMRVGSPAVNPKCLGSESGFLYAGKFRWRITTKDVV